MKKKHTLTKNSTAIFDIFSYWSEALIFRKKKKHKYAHTRAASEWENLSTVRLRHNNEIGQKPIVLAHARAIARALLLSEAVCVFIMWWFRDWKGSLRIENAKKPRAFCVKIICDDLRSWAFGKWSNERTLSLTFVWSSTSACITSHYDSVCALCLIARSFFLFHSLLVDSFLYAVRLLSQRSRRTLAACFLTKDITKVHCIKLSFTERRRKKWHFKIWRIKTRRNYDATCSVFHTEAPIIMSSKATKSGEKAAKTTTTIRKIRKEIREMRYFICV